MTVRVPLYSAMLTDNEPRRKIKRTKSPLPVFVKHVKLEWYPLWIKAEEVRPGDQFRNGYRHCNVVAVVVDVAIDRGACSIESINTEEFADDKDVYHATHTTHVYGRTNTINVWRKL